MIFELSNVKKNENNLILINIHISTINNMITDQKQLFFSHTVHSKEHEDLVY
jgi:hypothetical protein